MAKNFEITVEMLRDKGAYPEIVNKFKKIFGEKVVLDVPNIKKAVDAGDYSSWLAVHFLRNYDNIVEFDKFRWNSGILHKDTCGKEGNHMGKEGGVERCKALGKEHSQRCYQKFVELYRLENKAKKVRRKKNG